MFISVERCGECGLNESHGIHDPICDKNAHFYVATRFVPEVKVERLRAALEQIDVAWSEGASAAQLASFARNILATTNVER